MIKVNGTRRLTLRNRRFVRELDPRKTSLEDQHFEPNTEPPPVPITGKRKRMSKTPPAKTPTTWRPIPASPITSPTYNASAVTHADFRPCSTC